MTTPGSTDIRRAAERTRLAWRRTTLTATTVVLVAVVRLVLARTAPTGPRLGGWPVLGAVLTGLAVAGIFAVAARRVNRLDRGDSTAVRHAPAILALLVTACALLGLLAIT